MFYNIKFLLKVDISPITKAKSYACTKYERSWKFSWYLKYESETFAYYYKNIWRNKSFPTLSPYVLAWDMKVLLLLGLWVWIIGSLDK